MLVHFCDLCKKHKGITFDIPGEVPVSFDLCPTCIFLVILHIRIFILDKKIHLKDCLFDINLSAETQLVDFILEARKNNILVKHFWDSVNYIIKIMGA